MTAIDNPMTIIMMVVMMMMMMMTMMIRMMVMMTVKDVWWNIDHFGGRWLLDR